MSLLEDIRKEVGIGDDKLKFGQRRLAFLNQLAEILDEVDMSKEDIIEEFDLEGEQEYREIIYNPTLEDISKLEAFLGKDFLVFKRNLKFLEEYE